MMASNPVVAASNAGKKKDELRDELLFKQPDRSHLGDCPICFLPLPLDKTTYGMHPCCGQLICKGCSFANQKREFAERLKHKCPFCRKALPTVSAPGLAKKSYQKIAASDEPQPHALRELGSIKYQEGNYKGAVQYWSRAAELGDGEGHYNLSHCYDVGHGVKKDADKTMYHLEEAAINGSHNARYQLGCYEEGIKRFDRAVKHFIIAANQGDKEALQRVKECYKDGHVSKDDFAGALRGHQAAVDATKSSDREEVAKVNLF